MAFCPLGPSANKLIKAHWSWQYLRVTRLDAPVGPLVPLKRLRLINWNMWTLLKMALLCTDAAPSLRVGEQVCASYPSDTIHPKTHNASAPKTHASRLPIANVSYRLTLQAHCVITHSLKCTPLPLLAFTHMPCGLSWAIIGMFREHISLMLTVYFRHSFQWMCLWCHGKRTARTFETFSVLVGRSCPRRRSAPCAGGDAGRCRSIPCV